MSARIMDGEPELLHVIGLLYDSVLEETKWLDALNSLSEFVRGTGAFHVIANPQTDLITHGESVGVAPCVDQLQAGVIEGAKSHGAFDSDAQARYSRVMPHLLRAVRMRESMSSARASSRAYGHLIDTLPFGVALLDEVGVVIEVNNVAAAFFRKRSGLRDCNGRVAAELPDDDSKLQRAIQGITGAGKSHSAAGSTVAIRRAPPLRSLIVTVVPVTSSERLIWSTQPTGLMLIVDPEQAPQPRLAVLQRALGVSKSEGELANALFTGVSLREAAEILGVSINTCKTQLKSIYAKTGCRNHVELARVLFNTSVAMAAAT